MEYTTEFYGDVYRLRGDFSQATDEILRDGEDGCWLSTGKQVSDFGHRPEDAMRWELCEAVSASGDDPYEDEVFSKAIDYAVDDIFSIEDKA